MKKNWLTYLLALLVVSAFTACKDEEGREPGTDGAPVVTLYQYTVTTAEGYNPDNDTHLRVAVNNQVNNVYYLAELTDTRDAYVESNGEDAYNQYVVDNGTQVTVEDGVVDLYVTGIRGANTITVVGVGNGGALCSASATFLGYVWNTLATGQVCAPIMDGTTAFSWASGFTLQQREDNPDIYRIADLYGTGYHLIITAQGEAQTESGDYYGEEGNSFRLVTLTTLGTPYSTSDGQLSLSDCATYMSNSGYLGYNRLYENNHLYVYALLSVPAGYYQPNFLQFMPE